MTLYKMVSRLDEAGAIARDRGGRPLMDRVAMTEAEEATFEAERAALPVIRRYTPLEFMDLFSDEQQLAIVTATMTVPAVKLWYDRMMAAQVVDLSDRRVTAGLAALVSEKLLTQDRVDQLIGGA